LTSIIMALWDQLAFTQQCLESIEAFTPEEHEIIFIDNGSTDGTFEWLMEILPKHPNYKFIKNDTNLGAVRATNQGIGIAQGKYLCFLNNDTVVSKEWLKGLIECAESSPEIAMVGPRSNYISGPQIVTTKEDGYDSLFKYQIYAENYRKAFKGCYIPYWRVVPFCGLIKKEIIDKIGLFDERFFPGNFTDDDLCLRACLAGYRNLICGDVFIHHHGSISFKAMENPQQNLEDAEKVFDAKWARDYTISACLIVKDEAPFIWACLKSIYDYVDEIIVVDTGSKDQTKAIAQAIGPKVQIYDYEWVDDFSKARNFANSKATKDWILSVDADEVFEGMEHIRPKLRPYFAFRIVTRNYTTNPLFTNVTFNTGEDEKAVGVGWFPSTKIRLWPRDERIKFEYPVHEVVEQSVYHLGMGIIERKDVFVRHYGRMDESYDDKHGIKYYDLLHKNFEMGNKDLRSIEQLAIQAQGLKRYEDAENFWHEVLALDPKGALAPINLCHCHAERGDWKEAIGWARKAYELAPESKDAGMNLALCEFHVGDDNLTEKICKDLLEKHPYNPLTEGLLNATIKRRTGGEYGSNEICRGDS
jgi:GT2 family glycosyltransferase